MRLWSTVVSHDATFPRRQSARYGRTLSTLTAIYAAAPVFAYCFVHEMSASICASVQFVADGRHVAAAVPQQRLDPAAVAEQRVALERRPDVRVVEPVALLAHADPLLVAERPALLAFASALVDERQILVARHHVDDPVHQRVLDAAELGAARDVRADRRLEPRLVRPARGSRRTSRRGRAPTTSG